MRSARVRRLHSRAVTEEHAPPEDRRPDPFGDGLIVKRHGLFVGADLARGSNSALDHSVLGGSSRDHQHAGLLQPDVCLQRAHSRDNPLPGMGELQCPLRTEQRHQVRERRPVAVEEAAVPSARAGTAGLGLDEHDSQRRLTLL
jgi:hypothetical protein